MPEENMPHRTKIKIAALADIHVRQSENDELISIFKDISQKADILLLSGDLTDHGYIEEAETLAGLLRLYPIPVVGIFGNHDLTNGHEDEIRKIISPQPITLIDERPFIYKDTGFAGVKGFGGGFDKYMLTSLGESTIKQFVFEAIQEATALENLLTQLETDIKVVSIHYAPIRQTCEGEPLEIYPFAGSSRLEEPINNFGVSVVFHGHVHHGSHKGNTSKSIPVYNVCLSVLQKINPKQPYMLLEI